MAYWKDKWVFLNSNEYEYKYVGNYGARGEKRAKRKKATPEQIKKQNQLNREKKMRRLIKANYCTDDFWATLKYPEGIRRTIEEVQDDISNFLGYMRADYKKHSEPFKFIYRIEIGKRGGIHIHILINRLSRTSDTDLIIKKNWKHGAVNYQTLYEAGGYKNLANYIVKPVEEEAYEQISMFDKKEIKKLAKYSTSRNLIRPEPERKVYRKWTLKRMIEEGIKPTEGYYIDKNSIYQGVNKYTGMSYLQYTECRVKEISSRGQPGHGSQRINC